MGIQQQSNKSSVSFRSDTDLSPFSEILLVAKDEEVSREDRRVLRRTGFCGVQFFSSGVDAAKYILMKRENSNFSYSCLVICHEQLNDMNATTLLSLLRLHPKSVMIPFVVILSADSMHSHAIPIENRKEKYHSLGVFDILMRPFTPSKIVQVSKNAYVYYDKMNKKYKILIGALEKANDSLKLQYEQIAQEKIALFDLTIAKFSFTSPQSMSYEEAYIEGCKKFNHKLYDYAWLYFRHALATDSPYKAQALFSLYQLCKEWQKMGDSKIYLVQACQAYIEECAWDKVEECVMLFSKEFVRLPHPVLGMLTIAIKRSDVEQLSSLLRVSEKYLPHEDIANSIVKGCFHFELSSPIMRALSANVNVFTRVLELLQERKLERQVREQNVELRQATLDKIYEAATSKSNFSKESSGDDFLDNLSGKFLFDFTSLSSQNIGNLRDNNHFEVENLDDLQDKEQVRLGIGSKGSIESLPLVVLSDSNQGSFLRDIFSVAKQVAKIYKQSK